MSTNEGFLIFLDENFIHIIYAALIGILTTVQTVVRRI